MLETLPSVFRVVVPNDALAPRVRTGDEVELDSTITDYQPGDGVLVADSLGEVYLRRFRRSSGGVFQAYADSEAYPVLDSLAHGLRILAVVTGVPRQRWRA